MKEFESIYKNDFEEKINSELVPRPNSIFYEMEEFAKEKKIPILSPASGIILKFLCSIYKPKNILELGTGLGYSTAWMLSGFEESQIITLDRHFEQTKSAQNFLSKIFPKQNIQFVKTLCLDYLNQIENLHPFEFIFIDCDKIGYPEILDICKNKCKSGTKLVFDNVIWHGRIFEEKNTKPSDLAMLEFWKKVKKDHTNYEIFTSADGLLLLHL